MNDNHYFQLLRKKAIERKNIVQKLDHIHFREFFEKYKLNLGSRNIFKLKDAYTSLAMDYNFESWRELKSNALTQLEHIKKANAIWNKSSLNYQPTKALNPWERAAPTLPVEMFENNNPKRILMKQLRLPSMSLSVIPDIPYTLNWAGASTCWMNISDSNFRDAQFIGISFDYSQISKTRFDGCIFTDINHYQRSGFENCNITHSNCNSTILDKIYARDSRWSGTSFIEASIKNANLFSSKLDGCNFTNADLTETDMRRSTINDANFSGAILLNTRLHGVIFNKQTKFGHGTRINLSKMNASGNIDGLKEKSTQFHWQCENNHKWQQQVGEFLGTAYCPYCHLRA